MDEAYDKKLKEMQGYIPFLDEIIHKIENSSNEANQSIRGIQLSKIKSLKSLLCLTDKRMKIENLVRCEEILQKLKNKMGRSVKQKNKEENNAENLPTPELSSLIVDLKSTNMNFYKEYTSGENEKKDISTEIENPKQSILEACRMKLREATQDSNDIVDKTKSLLNSTNKFDLVKEACIINQDKFKDLKKAISDKLEERIAMKTHLDDSTKQSNRDKLEYHNPDKFNEKLPHAILHKRNAISPEYKQTSSKTDSNLYKSGYSYCSEPTSRNKDFSSPSKYDSRHHRSRSRSYNSSDSQKSHHRCEKKTKKRSKSKKSSKRDERHLSLADKGEPISESHSLDLLLEYRNLLKKELEKDAEIISETSKLDSGFVDLTIKDNDKKEEVSFDIEQESQFILSIVNNQKNETELSTQSSKKDESESLKKKNTIPIADLPSSLSCENHKATKSLIETQQISEEAVLKDNRTCDSESNSNAVTSVTASIINNPNDTCTTPGSNISKSTFEEDILLALRNEIESNKLINTIEISDNREPLSKLVKKTNINQDSLAKSRRISFEKYKEKLNAPLLPRSLDESINKQDTYVNSIKQNVNMKSSDRDISNEMPVSSTSDCDTRHHEDEITTVRSNTTNDSLSTNSPFRASPDSTSNCHKNLSFNSTTNASNTHNEEINHLEKNIQPRCANHKAYGISVEKHIISKSPDTFGDFNKKSLNNIRYPALTNRFNVNFPVSANYRGRYPKPIFGFGYPPRPVSSDPSNSSRISEKDNYPQNNFTPYQNNYIKPSQITESTSISKCVPEPKIHDINVEKCNLKDTSKLNTNNFDYADNTKDTSNVGISFYKQLHDSNRESTQSKSFQKNILSGCSLHGENLPKCESSKELSLRKSTKISKELSQNNECGANDEIFEESNSTCAIETQVKNVPEKSRPVDPRLRKITEKGNLSNQTPQRNSISHGGSIKDPRLKHQGEKSISDPRDLANISETVESSYVTKTNSLEMSRFESTQESTINQTKNNKIPIVDTRSDLKTKNHVKSNKIESSKISKKDHMDKRVPTYETTEFKIIHQDNITSNADTHNVSDTSKIRNKIQSPAKQNKVNTIQNDTNNILTPQENKKDHLKSKAEVTCADTPEESSCDIAGSAQINIVPNETKKSSNFETNLQKQTVDLIKDKSLSNNENLPINSVKTDVVKSLCDVLADKQKLLEVISLLTTDNDKVPEEIKRKLELLASLESDENKIENSLNKDSVTNSTDNGNLKLKENDKHDGGFSNEEKNLKRRGKSRWKNEVQLLKEALPEMFIKEDNFNTCGIRMCRLAKEFSSEQNEVALTKRSSRQLDAKKNQDKKNPETDETKINEKKLLVNIEKVDTIANISLQLSKSNDVLDKLNTGPNAKISIKPCPKSKKLKIKTLNATDESLDELQNACITKKCYKISKPCPKSKKKGLSETAIPSTNNDVSKSESNVTNTQNNTMKKNLKSVTKNIPIKKSRKPTTQRNYTEKEICNIKIVSSKPEKANRNVFLPTDNSSLNNYHFVKETLLYDCKYCSESFDAENIVNHYINCHPHMEILISRLSAVEVQSAISESQLRIFDNDHNKKQDYKCRFCEKIFCPNNIKDFIRHIAYLHTGEYEHGCKICSKYQTQDRNICCNKDVITKIEPDCLSVMGYVCTDCNFTQLLKRNIEAHMKNHDSVDKYAYRQINLSKLSPFQFSQKKKNNDSSFSDTLSESKEDIKQTIKHSDDSGIFLPSNNVAFFSNTISYIPSINELHIKEELIEPIDNMESHGSLENVHIKEEPIDCLFDDVKLLCNEDSFTKIKSEVLHERLSDKTFSVGKVEIKYSLNNILKECLCNINDCSWFTKEISIFRSHLERNHSEDCWNGFCENCNTFILHKMTSQLTYLNALDHLIDFHIKLEIPMIEESQADLIKIDIDKANDRPHFLKNELQSDFSLNDESCLPRISNVVSLNPKHHSLISYGQTDKFTLERQNPKPGQSSGIFICADKKCSISTSDMLDFIKHCKDHSENPQAGSDWQTCVYCRTVFEDTQNIWEHIIEDHGHCMYKCPVCSYRGASFILVFSHSMMTHKSIKYHSRVITIEAYPVANVKNFTKGLIPITGKLFLPFVCSSKMAFIDVDNPENNFCGQKLYTTNGFYKHMSSEHQNCDSCCLYCKSSPMSPTAMVSHMRSQHNFYSYKCSYCTFGNDSQISILQHLVEVHSSRTPIIYCRLSQAGEKGRLIKINLDDDVNYHIKKIFGIDIESELVNMHNETQNSSVVYDSQPNDSLEFQNENKIIIKPILTTDSRNIINVSSDPKHNSSTNIKKEANPTIELNPEIISIDSDDESYVGNNANELGSYNMVKGLMGTELYRCGFKNCTVACINEKKFLNHILIHEQSKVRKNFHCYHCQSLFYQEKTLIDHLALHGVYRFKCGICEMVFAFGIQCCSHLRIKHSCIDNVVIPEDPLKDNLFVDYFVVKPIEKAKGRTKKSTKNTAETAHKSLTAPNTKQNKFGPNDIKDLPLIPILSETIFCSVCSFSTKVTSNMLRHLQLHSSEVTVPNAAPVNPVPHLQTNEMHFDKMTNLALSSNIDRPRTTVEMSPNEPPTTVPEFIPLKDVYVCGSKDCKYICLDECMLKNHWKTLHKDETMFYCVHCKQNLDVTFGAPTVIIDHLNLHNRTLYRCKLCPFMDSSTSVTKEHYVKDHTISCVATDQDKTESQSAEPASGLDSTTTPIWWGRRKRTSRFAEDDNSSTLKKPPKLIKISNTSKINTNIPIVKLNEENKKKSASPSSNRESKNVSEPASGKGIMICIFCNQFSTLHRTSMKVHLYEELDYRKWACCICGYKTFDQEKIDLHSKNEHYTSPLVKELPVNVEIEKWVEAFLDGKLKSPLDPQTVLVELGISKGRKHPIGDEENTTEQPHKKKKMDTVSQESSDEEGCLVICDKNITPPKEQSTPIEIINTHVCLVCKKLLQSTEIQSHKTEYHQNIAYNVVVKKEADVFKCLVCSKLLPDYTSLDEHFTEAHTGMSVHYSIEKIKNIDDTTINNPPSSSTSKDTGNTDVYNFDDGHENSDFNFGCFRCDKYFFKYAGFLRHFQSMHKNEFIKLTPLTKVNIHDTGELRKNCFIIREPFVCIVSGCFVKSDSVETFKEHVKSHYAMPKQYACVRCSDIAFSNIEYFNHYKYAHPNLNLKFVDAYKQAALEKNTQLDYLLQGIRVTKPIRERIKNAPKNPPEVVDTSSSQSDVFPVVATENSFGFYKQS